MCVAKSGLTCLIACEEDWEDGRIDHFWELLKEDFSVWCTPYENRVYELTSDVAPSKRIELAKAVTAVPNRFDCAFLHLGDKDLLWRDLNVRGKLGVGRHEVSVTNVFIFSGAGVTWRFNNWFHSIRKQTDPWCLVSNDLAGLASFVRGESEITPRCCRAEDVSSTVALNILLQAFLCLALEEPHTRIDLMSDPELNRVHSMLNVLRPNSTVPKSKNTEEIDHIWNRMRTSATWHELLSTECEDDLEQRLLLELGQIELPQTLGKLVKKIGLGDQGVCFDSTMILDSLSELNKLEKS